MTILEAMHDKNLFRPLFKDFSTWRAWEVYLRALFGLGIEGEGDLKLLRDCTGLDAVSESPARESFVIAGRRSGKSFISSVIAVFLAAFKDWRPYLAAGEKGYIFVIANDRSQARIIKDYVGGILDSTPVLKAMVENNLKESIELKNGVTIAVKTSSYRTLRGFTVLAAIMEELSFWRSEESANPDREILAAIRPALATIPESLLVGISSPYARRGVLYDQYKRNFAKVGGPLIWKAETRIMNPTIDEETIKTAMEEDPAAARAEWLAEFREDIESFLSPEFIEAVTIRGRYELPKLDGFQYRGFIDPSGGSRDSFTLAIAHLDGNGLTILDLVRERKPPFSPEAVVSEFSELLKTYGVHQVQSDRYAGEWPREAFRKFDITVEPCEHTASEIYAEFLPLVTSKKVELLENKKLLSQLTNLERRTRSGGRDLIDHPPGLHDDVSNAVAGACVQNESPMPMIWRIQ